MQSCRTQAMLLLLLRAVGASFCDNESHLEKPAAKDLRRVTFAVHIHQLLILKSKSGNLITSPNDFIATVFIKTYSGLLD